MDQVFLEHRQQAGFGAQLSRVYTSSGCTLHKFTEAVD